MSNNKITDEVYKMALPLAEKNGCGIYEVEYKKEGADYVLRVVLDTLNDDEQSYVSLNSCEAVSRELSDILDEKDPISGAYMLEVTSPGLDRPLKKEEDFIRFKGKEIDVGLYKAINGSKTISGILTGFSDGVISLEGSNGQVDIKYSETAFVKLSVKF